METNLTTTPNTELAAMAAGQPPVIRFIAFALGMLLTDDTMKVVLNQVTPASNILTYGNFGGHPLSDYLGLSRGRIKLLFGFTDTEVTEIYAKLGVTEDTPEPEVPEADVTAAKAKAEAEAAAAKADTAAKAAAAAEAAKRNVPAKSK